MKIIPVIDILSGLAVGAYRGERDSYRPLRSELCPDADPAGLLRGYRALFPFTAVYIADLDAIQGRGDNRALIRSLAQTFPDLEIWLDEGGRAAAAGYPAQVHTVIGSETGITPAELAAAGQAPEYLLSLDFNRDGFMGDPTLLEQPQYWPPRCIAMTLNRVGSGEGPDTALLTALAARAPDRRWYAAGGIRNKGDLQALAASGAAGALVATALHNGTLTTADLEDLTQVNRE